MLLTITTTNRPATDLGYLLAKNPARSQSFELAFGKAHVFYPEASEERCTAALLLDLDPIGLVQQARRKNQSGLLTQYVNDRPYAASSFMSVAISRVFGTALSGRSRERQELADTAIPLEATIAVLPSRSGEPFIRELFEPLGYELDIQSEPLDATFESWGTSPYYGVTLRATKRLSELLTHLYVLIPVLDDEKHYWVGQDEVEKLLAKGGDWLRAHPFRQQISSRYLKRRRRLTRAALARLTFNAQDDPRLDESGQARQEVKLEAKLSLNEQRIAAVVHALREANAKRVIDIGCGEGKLLRALFADRFFERVVGMDVCMRSLEWARDRLRLDEMPRRHRERVDLFQGSLTYRDKRLSGYDAACLLEVIEHMDPSRLAACEHVLFEAAHPGVVIVTTPNVEHNVRFEDLPAGALRHHDHRFEWTREQFRSWANTRAERHNYSVCFLSVGTEDAEVGSPTQMAVFTSRGAS